MFSAINSNEWPPLSRTQNYERWVMASARERSSSKPCPSVECWQASQITSSTRQIWVTVELGASETGRNKFCSVAATQSSSKMISGGSREYLWVIINSFFYYCLKEFKNGKKFRKCPKSQIKTGIPTFIHKCSCQTELYLDFIHIFSSVSNLQINSFYLMNAMESKRKKKDSWRRGNANLWEISKYI